MLRSGQASLSTSTSSLEVGSQAISVVVIPTRPHGAQRLRPSRAAVRSIPSSMTCRLSSIQPSAATGLAPSGPPTRPVHHKQLPARLSSRTIPPHSRMHIGPSIHSKYIHRAVRPPLPYRQVHGLLRSRQVLRWVSPAGLALQSRLRLHYLSLQLQIPPRQPYRRASSRTKKLPLPVFKRKQLHP